MELQGKVAIVTGCSKGIGLATVKALLDKGVKVAGWSRTAPDLRHDNFKFFAADVRNIDSVNDCYNATVKEFGENISILINNAGLGYGALIEEMPVEEWIAMFETNVNGVFFCSQMVIPQMKAMGDGHIINIGSIAGTTGTEKLAGYCGTKFAVRGISQAMYKELRDFGIKVTLINPGSVQTPFFDNIDFIQANENMMKPEDIASAIIFALETSTNFHPVELEFRPLMPKGRKSV
ncbi:MAG TPA: SDR family NAD(P)-dependent oxidoreductase [Cytophagaceae bacterium]